MILYLKKRVTRFLKTVQNLRKFKVWAELGRLNIEVNKSKTKEEILRKAIF